MAKGPGVITGRSGTIGNVHYVESDYWPHNTALWVTDFQYTDPKFVYYFLQALGLGRFAGGSGVPTLNRNDAHSFVISIPESREEQRGISAALTHVDQFITALKRQIVKKQAIKHGMMQQLVTGRARLPGYTGEWVERAIGDAAIILDNLRVPLSAAQRVDRPGPFPYCGANGVLDHIDGYMIDDDVVLLAEDGGNFDQWRTRPIAYRMTGKIWVNNHAHVLKADGRGDTGFLFYSLEHKDITPFISSGTRSKLTRAELVQINLRMPVSADEQRAIASMLTDIDRTLGVLAERLAKARNIKTGMMQQLLTGRTRLPVEALA